jgi:D-alanyl-D-alanine carboxypeptidase
MHTGVSNTNISIGDRVLINGSKNSRNDRLFARIESAEM